MGNVRLFVVLGEDAGREGLQRAGVDKCKHVLLK